jgi:hypothetical protein
LPEGILFLVCFALSATAITLRLDPAMQAIHLTHPGFFYRLTPFRVEPIAYGAIVALLTQRVRGRDVQAVAG